MTKDVYKETPKPSFTEDFGSLALAVILTPVLVVAPLLLFYAAGMFVTTSSVSTLGITAVVISAVTVFVAVYNGALTIEKNKKN